MTGQTSQPHQISLAEMAAAAVGDQQQGSLGTAVYLLASLFNHSCTPNVDVTFPMNNSKSRLFCLNIRGISDSVSVWYSSEHMHLRYLTQADVISA